MAYNPIRARCRARQMREEEKARYLEVNLPKYPDALCRWQEYQKLIYRKFDATGLRYPQALDEAWIARTRYNTSNALGNKRK